MTKLKRIVAYCLLMAAASVAAKPSDNLIIIEGHFFSEMPVAASEITGMSRVSTPSGAKAMMFTLANPLPEEALKYALPVSEITDGELLLQKSAGANVISLTVAKPTEQKITFGDMFPQFRAKDIDGKEWSNVDVAGKAMVLNLWFTGCGPCRAEMPELSQWKNEMPDVMFFSATYENAATARPVLEKQGFNWIALVDDTQFKEWIDETGYPLTIVVDKTGKIAHVEHGTSPVQREQLKAMVQSVR